MENPFGSFKYGHYSEWFDAQSRLDRVKEFNLPQLAAALEVPGLQKTVRTAIERRMKRLQLERDKTTGWTNVYG
jgi:hypothetical protein